MDSVFEKVEGGCIVPDYSFGFFIGKDAEKIQKTIKKPIKKTISRRLRHKVFKRDNYRCIECGATNKDTRLHIDHVLPVCKGGSNDIDNLQVLCETCNLSKHHHTWKGGIIE